MSKTFSVKNSEDLKEKISVVEVIGNPDAWVLICKASSKSEGWMKSTRAMYAGNGVLVQVSTQQGDNVSEALCYLPGCGLWRNGGGSVLILDKAHLPADEEV